MSKKIKILIIIVLILILAWLTVFIVDYNRCSNMKEPIFVIVKQENNLTMKSTTYQGLGYKVEVEKNVSQSYGEQIVKVEMYMFDKFITGAISDVETEINEEKPNEEEIATLVQITEGKIKNENLIDEFIAKCNDTNEIISLQIAEETRFIQIDFVPSEISRNQAEIWNSEEQPINIQIPETNLDFELAYGYYILTINRQEKGRYAAINWRIKRINENEQVILCLETGYGSKAEKVEICRYDLHSSNYKKEVNLNFHQRKDMGTDKIIDKNSSVDYDFDIYTVGGDVSFIFDTDMVYEVKTALEEKVVTVDDILEQAKIDSKYGICEEGMYSDGGTIEYKYENYIIIKYNTLDGNRDLVIAPQGENMRNRVDDILYE